MNFLNNYLDLAGKTILVTGASSGVGKNVAKLLDETGAKLILNGRNITRLNETLNLLKYKCNHRIVQADLTDVDYDDFIQNCQREEQPISGVAHCAGEHFFAPLRSYHPDVFRKILNDYTVSTASLFISMIRNKKSKELSLVTMSSISTSLGITGNALYASSRIACESLCRNIAIEFATRGVRCNYVKAGHMTDSMMVDDSFTYYIDKENFEKDFPLKIGKTIDAAKAIVFLLSSASSWITGQSIVVDGGFLAKG